MKRVPVGVVAEKLVGHLVDDPADGEDLFVMFE